MFLRILLFVLTIISIFLLPQIATVEVWDHHAVSYLADHRIEALIQISLILAWIGSGWGFLVALLLPVLFYLIKKRWATALFYFLGVGLLRLAGYGLKFLVARPRPAEAMMGLSTFSMPSGHANNAVMIFGVLAIFLMRKIKSPFGRGLSFIICFAIILATDFSRLYLGVHFPSDVVMGSLYATCGLWVLQGFKRDLFSF